MYTSNVAPVVPVVAGAGTVAALPTSGANSVAIMAAAVLAGLVTWGVVYYYRSIRASHKQ